MRPPESSRTSPQPGKCVVGGSTARTDPVAGWPSQHEAFELHRSLSDDDPVASSDFAVAYLDLLADWLERRHPRVDPHLCTTAAEDSILAVIRRPQTYDPSRSSLQTY